MGYCRIDNRNFAFARARVYKRATNDFFFLGRLTGLIFSIALLASGCVPSRVAAPEPAPIVDTNRFDDLLTVERIEIRRVNPRNGAEEIISLDSAEAVVRRNVKNFKKSLKQEPASLTALADKIRAMGKIVVRRNRAQEQLDMTITVHGVQEKRTLILDPEDKLNPVYAEVMRIREDVLKHGQ